MMARVQYMISKLFCSESMDYTKIDIVEDTKPDNIRTKWSTSFESRSPEGSTNQDVSIQNFMNMNGRTIFFINFALDVKNNTRQFKIIIKWYFNTGS